MTMKHIKMRLAVFLSVIMILPSIMAILPAAPVSVSAASSYVQMDWNGIYHTQVEQGQEFYIGDFATVYTYGKKAWRGTASMTSASYSSSNSSVASIDKKGYFTAKATGKTKIKVKYQGKEIEEEIEVVEAGTFTETAAVSGLRERAGKLSKKNPSKITAKNAYSLYKLAADIKAYAAKNANEISADGHLVEKSQYSNTYYQTTKLAVPQAGRYYTFLAALQNEFGYKNNPTSTQSAKVMRIQSISAKPTAITVKLKKKIDATQILAARICNEHVGNEQIKGKNKAYISVPVIDVKSNTAYSAVGEIKKGSAVVKIKSFQKFVSQKSKYVNVKLKKGRTYKIDYGFNTWSKGKTVTVR